MELQLIKTFYFRDKFLRFINICLLKPSDTFKVNTPYIEINNYKTKTYIYYSLIINLTFVGISLQFNKKR
jgi:hypothetical protein